MSVVIVLSPRRLEVTCVDRANFPAALRSSSVMLVFVSTATFRSRPRNPGKPSGMWEGDTPAGDTFLRLVSFVGGSEERVMFVSPSTVTDEASTLRKCFP